MKADKNGCKQKYIVLPGQVEKDWLDQTQKSAEMVYQMVNRICLQADLCSLLSWNMLCFPLLITQSENNQLFNLRGKEKGNGKS